MREFSKESGLHFLRIEKEGLKIDRDFRLIYNKRQKGRSGEGLI